MTPQEVEVVDGMAYIFGIPDPEHDCDAMGCPSIAHVIAIVPCVANDGSERATDNSSTIPAKTAADCPERLHSAAPKGSE